MRRVPSVSIGAWLALSLLALPNAVSAHDFRLGAIVIEHPYATPSAAGASEGSVFFRALKNTDTQPDRLLAARSPRAAAVQIQRQRQEAGAPRTVVLPALELPPRAELRLRHDGDTRLALVGLQAALQDGQCFALWLRFERAGEREVTVCVQTPRDASPPHSH